MSAEARLTVIDKSELPVYPISADERLDGNTFVKWNTLQWLASTTRKMMPMELQGYYRDLLDQCQIETPVGTLPDNDAELGRMLRVDAVQVREWRRMEYGPLRHWVPCLCDGRVRLMHHVVTRQVLDALNRRALAELSKSEKSVAMRIKRLRDGMARVGWSKEVLSDHELLKRVDEWLLEHKKGRRDDTAYESAALAAIRLRWITPDAVRGN